MKHKTIIFHLIFVIIISCSLSFYYYKSSINEFPSHVHAWTQSDRYSLALGFIDNGGNFFKPATFNLMPDPKQKLDNPQGITPVDFPINEYNVSILMRLFKTTEPWVFRIYNLLYGLIGLFFLSLIVTKKQNFIFGSFVFIFVFTSPVYTYYLNGFIPTITSLSSFFIGLYFLDNYINSYRKKDFIFSVLFFTLAALCRAPFIIPLTALLLQRILSYYRSKKINISEIYILGLAYLVFGAYFIYNIYLKSKYGSAFLGNIMPPENLHEVKQIIVKAYQNWHFHYFTISHYLIIFILLGYMIFYFVKKKKIETFQKQIFELGLIALIGAIIYAFLLLKQFPNHDYYFYDTFYPVIIIFILFAISLIPTNQKANKQIFSIILFSVFSVIMIFASKSIQEKRKDTGDWDRVEITKQNFLGVDKYLDSIGIPKNAKMLVIDAYTTNAPLILMNRKGYTVLNTSKENIIQSLTWNYDYIVIQNCFLLSDVVKNYPEIINYLKKVDGNNKITIYKYLKTPQETNILSFLDLDKQKPVWIKTNNFDTLQDSCWRNTDTTSEIYYSKPVAGVLKANNEFGISLNIANSKEIYEKECLLSFNAVFYTKNEITKCKSKIVLSIDNAGKNVYYRTYDINTLIQKNNKWEDVFLLFTIPKVESINNQISIYIWDPDKSGIFYDNISVSLY